MRARFTLSAVLLIIGSAVLAQEFPARTVRIVAPFPAGGGTDLNVRRLAQQLNRIWGQPVVVENVAGAAGNVAAAAVAAAKPDGYTLFFATHPIFAINPSLYERLPFNADRDFAPVVLVSETPHILLVSHALRVTKVSELIGLAKASPGKIHFGSGGQGTSLHLSGELLKSRAGIDLMHVPYKGTIPALAALAGGEIQMLFDSSTYAVGHIRGGRVRGLAIASLARLAIVPEVPTFDESGLRGFTASLAHGFVVPAATPAPVVSVLNRAINTVIRDADYAEQMTALGVAVVGGTPEAFRSFLAAERRKWDEIIKAQGIKLN
jgi:tripartite-type tricarboxylate transporter receptor subunit TctC